MNFNDNQIGGRFFPSFQNENKNNYRNNQWSALYFLFYSIQFYSLCVVVFFAMPNKKIALELNEFARYLEHVIIQVTAYIDVCVCVITLVWYNLYTYVKSVALDCFAFQALVLTLSLALSLVCSLHALNKLFVGVVVVVMTWDINNKNTCSFICMSVDYIDNDQSVFNTTNL